MTAMKINFGALEAVAANARAVQSELNGYADDIPGVVNNPLSSLPMGASSDTSSAASLATKKANSLRNRAGRYNDYARKIDRFASDAKQADDRVASSIKSVADTNSSGLNIFQQIGRYINNAINGILGPTPFGSMVRTFTGALDYADRKMREIAKTVLDWFRHGEGRYILNAAASIVGTAIAIFGAISAIAACLVPPVGAIAVVMAVAASVAAIVSVVDTMATLHGTVQALSNNATEPGIARYYGNISDASSWAKRETQDAGLRGLAAGIDFVGAAAGIVSSLGSLCKVPSVPGAAPSYKLSADVVKTNLLKSFGLTKVDGGLKFSAGTLFGIGGSSTPWCFADKAKQTLDPIDNIISTAKWAFNFDGISSVKDVTKGLSIVSKTFDGLKAFSWPNKIYKVYETGKAL